MMLQAKALFTTSSVAQVQRVSHETLTLAEKARAWDKSINDLTLAEARYLASTTKYERPHLADNYMQDSRNWPDPTEPRPSSPPEPKGCTCELGDKLNCPVHGLHGSQKDLDNQWANVQQANPVGFPQDAPQTWGDNLVHSSVKSIVKLQKLTNNKIVQSTKVLNHPQNQSTNSILKVSLWESTRPIQKLSKIVVKSQSNLDEITPVIDHVFVTHSNIPIVSHVASNKIKISHIGDSKSADSANKIDWQPHSRRYVKRCI